MGQRRDARRYNWQSLTCLRAIGFHTRTLASGEHTLTEHMPYWIIIDTQEKPALTKQNSKSSLKRFLSKDSSESKTEETNEQSGQVVIQSVYEKNKSQNKLTLRTELFSHYII